MRPSWDEVWMNVARDVAKRSRCVPSQVGCVIVSATNVSAAIAYNGPPANFAPAELHNTVCTDWCPHARALDGGRSDYMDCFASHAEMNAIVQVDPVKIMYGTAYVTRCPCFMCAKMLSNSGIARVVFPVSEDDVDRPIDLSVEIMIQSGLELIRV